MNLTFGSVACVQGVKAVSGQHPTPVARHTFASNLSVDRIACTSLACLILVAILGCSSGSISADYEKPISGAKALEVDLVPVRRSSIHSTLELVGTLIPVRATKIAAEVDGVIESFPTSDRCIEYEENGKKHSIKLGMNIGHGVQKGEILVKINPAELILDLEVAKTNCELVKKDLENLLSWRREEEIEQLRANVDQMQAAYDRALADMQRSGKLLEKRVTSQSQHDAAVMALRQAAAMLRESKAALKLAEAGPTKQQIAVAKAKVTTMEAAVRQCEEKLSKTTIRCPYNAIISERYIDVGERVTAVPHIDILQIIDVRVLFARLSVPERYQRLVKLGDIVRLRAEGGGDDLAGRIDFINGKIDPKSRSFRLCVTIDNRKEKLKPGGFVRAKLPLRSVDDALVVPADSLTFTAGRPAVFVYDDGLLEKRCVLPGISDQKQYEIISGLSEGELVVTGRTALLANGLRVRPNNSDCVARSDEGEIK